MATWRHAQLVALLGLGLGAFLPGVSAAQDTGTLPRTPHVVMDRHNVLIANVLPFDEPFIITGAGGANLRQIDLWYDDSTLFTRESCVEKTKSGGADLVLFRTVAVARMSSRTDSVPLPHATWRRPRGGNDTFLLAIDSTLPPNRDFTFCVRSLTTPSSVDSAAFQQNAVALLRRAIREVIRKGAVVTTHDTTELWGFHSALQAALPAAGKLVLLDESSILRPRQKPVTDRAKDAVLLEQVRIAFAGFLNLELSRRDAGDEFNRTKEPFAGLLHSKRDSPALSGLIRAATATKPPPQAEPWFANALSTAVTLSRITEREAHSVASGWAPITRPSMAIDPDSGAKNFTLGEAERRARNMEETSARLDDLRNLVIWLLENRTHLTRAGMEPSDLVPLLTWANQARPAAASQKISLDLIRQTLQRADEQVVQLAATLAAQDLSSMAIASTTAANYEARARWYVGPDVGVLYAYQDDTNEVHPYVSANFYFAPVNKRASLGGTCFLTSLRCLLRRTSLSVGITTGKFEREGLYSGPIGGRSVFVAPGFRVTDFLRLSYGAAFINTYTPDSERDRRLTAVPAGAVSIDFALKDVLGGLATALFGN